MPPEDLPPLAPFPDLTPASQSAGHTPAGEVPLLSSSQRQEFALVADSLQGLGNPMTDEANDSLREGDFLLIVPEDRADAPVAEAAPRILLPEEPVSTTDFLDLPPVEGNKPGLADDGFDLRSIATALTSSAIPLPVAMPEPEADEWSIASLISPLAPSKEEAPSPSPDTFLPVPVPMPSPPLRPIPIAIEMPPPALITAKADHSSAAAPEAAPFLFQPAAFPPFPSHLEEQPDFDEPLSFPVPSALGIHRAEPMTPTEEIGDPADRSFGMVLSGAVLILLGMIIACRIPGLALEADSTSAATRGPFAVRTWHLHGEMFLSLAGAAGILLLGIGSATLRRWAPPLIHAAGWVVLLTVLVCMGAATASMFYLSSNATAGDAVASDGTMLFAFAGIFGIALPLGLIALFQRPSVARLCKQTDDNPRWTDRHTVPALMVFITGVLLAIGCFTLAAAHSGMPVFGEIGDGRTGIQAWTATGIIAAVGAALTAAGKRSGWWTLLSLSSLLAVSLFLTCQGHDWHTLAQLPAAPSGSLAGGIFAASAMLPAILILLMTRRALQHDHERA